MIGTAGGQGAAQGFVTGAVTGFTGGFMGAALRPFIGCGRLANLGFGFANGAASDALGQGAAMALGLQENFRMGQMLFSGAMGAAVQYFLRPCFAAGTPLLWEHGTKAIETFQPGERVWARNEFDPLGPLALKVVEEVFSRTGRILHLHVGGRIIQTTAEHPFYEYTKGWIVAAELKPGDMLSSHDGQWVAIEEVYDTGEYETVYNLRVADYHTYFVGGEEWALPGQCCKKEFPGVEVFKPGTL